MKTIGDFIKENNLTVTTSVVNGVHICKIKNENDTFTFSMTEEKLREHIKKNAIFADKVLENTNMKKTHFMRLALTWYHIQEVGDNLPREIKIE